MLKRFVFLVLLAGFLGSFLSPAAAVERRVALVIGNAQYRDAPLANPLNDARDMAAALRRLGFEVIELIDGSQKDMNRAIAKFGDRLNSDAVALFYYAGHGMQVRGKNYLIPVDAQITNETSIRVESVDVDAVLDQLSGSELNVVILDACRNNPFERRFRNMGGGLAQMDAPKGSLIAYATAPGKTAADGDGRNGLFTRELLKQIQVPGQPIEQVFKNVRREVARATRDNQIPWESSSLTGDFYFTPLGQAPLVVSPPVVRGSEKASVSVPEVVSTEAPPAKMVSAPPIQLDVPPAQPAPLAPKSAPPEVATEQVIKTDTFTVKGAVAVNPASGAMTGEVVIEWVNGDRYQGGLLDGKKHGRGIFSWQDGKRYDGEWENDLINGRGALLYANGDRYEGSFIGGEPHGHGVYTLKNGDVYSGAWFNGNKHGQGRLTWASGDYWEGEFRDDRQTENGKLVYGESREAPPSGGAEKPLASGKAASKPAAQKKAR